MDLCAGCGSLTLADACARCGATQRLSPPDPWPLWVALRCTLVCRSCGHRTPLDDLERDGSVACRSCGIDQAFSLSAWKDMLEELHGLADLAGSPEGRNPHARLSIGALNPHKSIGIAKALVEWKSELEAEDGIKQVMRVEAAPGHPVCPRGHGLLDVRFGADIDAACPQCDLHLRYSRTEQPPYERLRAVLSDAARLETVAARPGTRDGLDGYSCPGCGAPLPVEEGRALATCSFCHLSSKVPRGKGKSLKPAPPALWWVLFAGPSPLRGKLERSPTESARGIEEAPIRQGRDPVGAGLRWGPWLILPTLALVVSGLVMWMMVRQGMISPEWATQ